MSGFGSAWVAETGHFTTPQPFVVGEKVVAILQIPFHDRLPEKKSALICVNCGFLRLHLQWETFVSLERVQNNFRDFSNPKRERGRKSSRVAISNHARPRSRFGLLREVVSDTFLSTRLEKICESVDQVERRNLFRDCSSEGD